MILSDEQKDALFKIEHHNEKYIVVGGYAGTGKTTIANQIKGNKIFLSYTGKAASVLRSKGCTPCGTIHQAIYAPQGNQNNQIKIDGIQQDIADAVTDGRHDDARELRRRLSSLRRENGSPRFSLNYDSKLKDFDTVIIDEYSMLDEYIIRDILKLAKRIVFFGDPFQLPPIKGESPLKPHIMLTHVHRQALDSPVLRAAMRVREGKMLEPCNDGDFVCVRKADSTPEMYTQADQVIVGLNKTRVVFNKRFREIAGRTSLLPEVGDKVICLKNNHSIPIFNGEISVVSSCIEGDSDDYIITTDACDSVPTWRGDVEGRGEEYNWKKHEGLERFDFAGAITAHKSQGSEWDNITVLREPVGNGIDARKWLYTSLTRSRKQCTLVI